YAVGLDHPRTAVVLARLGALARRRGDLEAAIEYLDRALASGELAYGRDGSELIGPLLDEGTVLAELGRHADAARSLDRAQALADAHPHAGAALGIDVEAAIALAQADAAMARGDPAQALEHVARVRVEDAGEFAAHTAVIAAEALLEFDRVEEALARARQAQRLVDVPGARSSVLTLRMLVAIGRAELRLGASTLAAEALRRAVTELEGVGGVAPVLRARARFELARALAGEGATAEAIDELVRAAQRELTGSDPRVLLLRGELATWLAGRTPARATPR
ncbi:MAG: tetratricopeptide repeat protein, partial [Myxococcales bacterium]|nr:tetratricopeptide repeat protein [Myxococcales bacterium]